MRLIKVIPIFFTILKATIINVPSDYGTIQAGIDQAEEGDTVLVSSGTYYENLMINKEIVLASQAIFDDLSIPDWYNNSNITGTIINGSGSNNPKKRSCLIVRDGDIQPTIKGFTFEGGVGTNMLILDCSEGDNIYRSELTGGGVLIYDAYPIINYNRFMNNGITPETERGRKGSKNGGAIAHYEDAEVEFDEDRDSAPSSNSNISRTVPGTMDIQNNYFEGNTSGNGQGFYSFGYDGSIDVSNSVFENVDCGTNTVNEYVLNSAEGVADYVQDGVTGECIDENAFYVATTGNNSNNGTESAPFLTIAHALSFVKPSGNPTTIYVASGTYSPDLTGEIFPINIPNNVHLIGEDSETTILDADADAANEAAVVIIQEVETLTFKNFTLVNGYTEGHGCRGGGGLLVSSNNLFDISLPPQVSTPVIENLIIENNWSHNGGGISFFLVDGPVLSNIVVRNNESTFHGGGVFIYVSNVEFTDLIVSENRNWGNPMYWNVGNGGGIMSVASGVDIHNLTLTDNIGVTLGGGLFNMGNSLENPEGFTGFTIDGGIISGNEGYYGGGMSLFAGADPVLNNLEISNNHGISAGGGVHMDNATPLITNCLIKENVSPEGGGVFAFNSETYPIIENTVFELNESNEGGGIYYKNSLGGILKNSLFINNYSYQYTGGVSIDNGTVEIINCTITGNSAQVDGGIAAWGGNANIINSIIWDNQPSSIAVYDGYQSEIDMNYSNTDDEGWEGGQNISIDPLYVDTTANNYSLQIESPCIDAGTADISTYIPGMENITEFVGAAPDMGAFETILDIVTPANINYTPQGSSILLTWSSGSASYQFKVEKSLVSDFSDDIEEFFVDINNFSDSDLDIGIEYYYRVTAIFAGIVSEPSEIISAMIVPAATGLVYEIQSDLSVTISWDADENATNYKIKRSRDPGFFGPSDEFTSTDNNYNDNTIPHSTMYHYRITTYYGEHRSLASENVSLLIVPTPIGISYTTDESTVTLTWDVIDIATEYIIERATDSLFTNNLLEFSSEENNYIDTNLELDINYYYRVRAACCDGAYISMNSEISNVILTPVMDIASIDNLPSSYNLHQNFPNPFNPITQIRYDLQENTFVSVNIYDITGKHIKSLINADQLAGFKSIYWNATDTFGQSVPAGMYVYTIQAGDFMQSKKMLLLK